jgi:hypothetical protein
MVLALEHDELRSRDSGCELASLLEGMNTIIAGVEDESRDAHLFEQAADIEKINGRPQARRNSPVTWCFAAIPSKR